MPKQFIPVLTAISAILFNTAFADSVNAVQAETAANAWLARGRAPMEMSGRAVSTVTTLVSGDAKMHVANLEGGGFVVMPTDDLIDPIIAFSPTGGSIDQDERNPLWALLTRDLACRASVLTNASATVSSQGPALASAPVRTAAQQHWDKLLAATSVSPLKFASTIISEPRVDSFVPTRWNQTTVGSKNVYNYYTPHNYYCGCTVTATAQIMRYFAWPTAAVAAKTFTCRVDGTSGDYTMKGGVYDWSNMPVVPTSAITDAQAAAIGKLTYDIGCAAGINWSSGGSGASLYSVRLRLLDTFGYASCEGVVFLSGTYPYTLENCKQIVIPCLDYGTPLLMSISGSSGHAVVVDGYGYSDGDFYLHVNCGWGGDSDAWYCPPDFKTSYYTYTAIDGFIYQILPRQTGTIISGRVLNAAGAPVKGAEITLKSGTSVKATAKSGAYGIYAVLAPEAGSYTVTATANGKSASLDVSVLANSSKQLSDNGGYYSSSRYAPTIGNTYGNDLQITGLGGADLTNALNSHFGLQNVSWSMTGTDPWCIASDNSVHVRVPAQTSGTAALTLTVTGKGKLTCSISSISHCSINVTRFKYNGSVKYTHYYCTSTLWPLYSDSFDVDTPGTTTLEWSHEVGSASNNSAADGCYIDSLTWEPEGGNVTVGETSESDVPVPYAWLDRYFPGQGTNAAAYETLAAGVGANGYKVWESYLAGLDPTNAASCFSSTVSFSNGLVRVGWTPNLNATGAVTRIYTVFSRAELGTGEWETPPRLWHRFFKIKVAMPTGAEGETSAVADEGFVPERNPDELGGVQLWENGPYWAECNLGATKPEEYGYYFWWGDTTGYQYTGSTWNGVDGTNSNFSFTSCPTYQQDVSSLQSLGYVDATGTLVAAHDAAAVSLGTLWCMPTADEFAVLVSNCTVTVTSRNGVGGWLVAGKGSYASCSIFLPAAGFGIGSYFFSAGSYGYYWSSTTEGGNNYAGSLNLYSDKCYLNNCGRYNGQSIRPLRRLSR